MYYLFDWLHNSLNIPGAGVFQYISFRAAGAIITSLLITIVFGKKLIELLRKKQVGETVRDLGLEGQKAKEGTPTMGGLIILAAILIPTLLFAKLDNIYVIIMLITTVWLGALGFIDDYIKVLEKLSDTMQGINEESGSSEFDEVKVINPLKENRGFMNVGNPNQQSYQKPQQVQPQKDYARKLNEITYDEMLELASLGANVLHNRSVEMAKKYNVELEVLSSLEKKPGTIVKEIVKMEKTLIKGVAKDNNVANPIGNTNPSSNEMIVDN